MLDDLGFDVTEAENGALAVGLLKTLPPFDLIITDQFMPNGDGWVVLEWLLETSYDAPAILISAAPPTPPPNWRFGCGFSVSFLKPLDHRRFVQHIGDVLGLTWIGAQGPDDQSGNQTGTATAGVTKEIVAAGDSRALSRADALLFDALCETGQVSAIAAWAERLKADRPERTDFADQVIAAARELDFTELAEIAKAMRKMGRE